MALFIEIEIDPALAREGAAAQRLAEVCPVDIFEVNGSGVHVVDANVDECTLCELCLSVGKPGQVAIHKLYDPGVTLKRAK